MNPFGVVYGYRCPERFITVQFIILPKFESILMAFWGILLFCWNLKELIYCARTHTHTYTICIDFAGWFRFVLRLSKFMWFHYTNKKKEEENGILTGFQNVDKTYIWNLSFINWSYDIILLLRGFKATGEFHLFSKL